MFKTKTEKSLLYLHIELHLQPADHQAFYGHLLHLCLFLQHLQIE